MNNIFKKDGRRTMVHVTTSIPLELREAARAAGVTIQSLVIQGWGLRAGFPAMLERTRELETKVVRLSALLEKTQQDLWNIEKHKED